MIVQYVYQKEKIEVPEYEDKAVFHMYGSPKEVHDDPAIFTTVARIPDAMLKKVDPTNNVLVSYLQSIDTTVVTGMLQQEEKKKSKKSKKTEEEVEQVPETPEDEIPKEVETLQSTEISKRDDIKLIESTSLPQVTSTTDSPTFQSIMDQPFTTIFSTQSTDPPNSSSPVAETMAVDEETDNEGFGGTFEALSFDKAEEDFPDHMLMTMKQFKILNSKLNSILQSQADVGSAEITIMEVDSIMKEMESRMISKASGLIHFLYALKQIEEAGRLASLLKKRELKAAGIYDYRKRKNFFCNAEIPFEIRPPIGFYDIADESSIVEQPKFLTTIEEMEGERRADREARLRKQDIAKNKIAWRSSTPHALLFDSTQKPCQE
ncbi:unnamed protein product [Lactuca saligna]|uniref:Uncharacterized protein n=1 Tax=Lactuca saligna TaxID=75948 RepID=A0AA35Z6Y0_LACSI|nr:unnamed protein product [Lactuca saligna]